MGAKSPSSPSRGQPENAKYSRFGRVAAGHGDKEKGAALKSIDGPAARPLNRDSFEARMTGCCKWEGRDERWYVTPVEEGEVESEPDCATLV